MTDNSITPADVMMLVGVVAIVMPVLTALGLFLLNRLFGGDDDLRNKVHALELAAEKSQNHTREHVAAQYATKGDIGELKETVRGFAEAQRQYHEALMTLLNPIANQLIGVSPVRKS